MSKFWFGVKIFLFAAAVAIAVYDFDLLPASWPDWPFIAVGLLAGMFSGLLQKWADFQRLVKEISDLLIMFRSGNLDIVQFEKELREVLDAAGSLWRAANPFDSKGSS